MRLTSSYMLLGLMAAGTLLGGCAAKDSYTGMEYAPNMYHSVPYEPLSQIDDMSAGSWVSSLDGEQTDAYGNPVNQGEYYNSNPLNPNGMTMREPAPNTVRRMVDGALDLETQSHMLPYRIPADSLDYAATAMESPFEASDEILKEGETLYLTYCEHCHGVKGDGNGKVVTEGGLAGVPNYAAGRYATLSQAHIFHVITHGKGLMGAHGSQVAVEDRWKIARWVEVLQKK